MGQNTPCCDPLMYIYILHIYSFVSKKQLQKYSNTVICMQKVWTCYLIIYINLFNFVANVSVICYGAKILNLNDPCMFSFNFNLWEAVDFCKLNCIAKQ